MKCSCCGSQNKDHSTYCKSCGKALNDTSNSNPSPYEISINNDWASPLPPKRPFICWSCTKEIGEDYDWCSFCGKDLRDYKKFKRIQKVCASCSNPLNKDQRFCSKCGAEYTIYFCDICGRIYNAKNQICTYCNAQPGPRNGSPCDMIGN